MTDSWGVNVGSHVVLCSNVQISCRNVFGSFGTLEHYVSAGKYDSTSHEGFKSYYIL